MRAIPCPVSKTELEQLYLIEKLTDDEVAARIGKEAFLGLVEAIMLALSTDQKFEQTYG